MRLTTADLRRAGIVLPGTMPKKPLPADGMNDWERDYSKHLELQRRAGLILWYAFEGVRLRLNAPQHAMAEQRRVRIYTPDFAVMNMDGVLEFVEVKGFWREAARVRIEVAAAAFPFKFTVVKKAKGVWATVEVFNDRAN
jgi:hypothetical protein